MKYALLTSEQLASLRPSLGTIANALARKATSIGSKVPTNKRPSQTYSDEAVGWTVPYAIYPQQTGRTVVVMEDDAWAMLSKPSQNLFTLDGLPEGFSEGQA